MDKVVENMLRSNSTRGLVGGELHQDLTMIEFIMVTIQGNFKDFEILPMQRIP